MDGKKPVFFIVKNRVLGDSIMGLASVQYLRALYPESTIIYAVPAWMADLYKSVRTDADVIYPLKMKTFVDVINLYTDLLNFKVTAIHEMHQSGSGKKVFSLFSFLKNIPYTFHNHHLKSGTKVLDQGVIKELIQRDLDGVFSYYGEGRSTQSPPHYLDFTPRIYNQKLAAKKKLIIMGVVATRLTKMWPLDFYVRLANLFLDAHPDYKIIIPLSKSAADTEIFHSLTSLGLPANTTIVQLPLQELAAAFSEAQFYIGNDTGLKHLAVAVGIKTYTFFGPEPANEWHPYDRIAHPYFYREGLACRVRTHHYCGLAVCDLKVGYMQCLNEFMPEKVMSELDKNF
jgi:heptosyltransferase-2